MMVGTQLRLDRLPLVIGHDDLTDVFQPDRMRSGLQLDRAFDVGVAGVCVAAGVVVCDGERKSVVTKHAVQDFPHRHQRLVDATQADHYDVPDACPSVADDEQ